MYGDFISMNDISQFRSPEAAAMVQMLRVAAGTLSASEALSGMPSRKPSSPVLLGMMTGHGICGAAIPSALTNAWLSAGDRETLLASDHSAALWNLTLYAEQQSLRRILDETGLPYLFVKGLMFGWLLHGDLTTRATRDIDVMVLPAHVAAFRTCLLSAGYEEVYHFPMAHQSYARWLNREAVYRKRLSEGVYVHVELQWSPVLSFYGIPVETSRLFEGSMIVPLGGFDWRMPSAEAHLMVLLLHHGVTDGWRSLRHILDVSLFLRRLGGEVEWTGMRALLRGMGMMRNASAGFALCRALAGVDVPEGFEVGEGLRHRLEATLLSERPLTRDQRSWAFLRRQWYLADGARGRSRLVFGQIRKAISPGLAELEGIPLPQWLFPLYYLCKPLRPL
ncbi:MAG: hypothetical protein EBZ67_03470, partial [Chitinophagia bacterium]|nr:hypothetical protein [Chitinophagia bacterium]